MTIQAGELVWRRPQESSDVGSNGGRMTSTVNPSGVKNNTWPDVPAAEREAGSTKYRKVFIHVSNDDDLTLIAPKVFVETRTPGDDNVTFIAATQRNKQSAITGSEQKYGAGVLNATVAAGATTIQVAVEDAALAIFANGMKIRVSDKASVSGTGNEEYVTINGVPSYAGNVATLTFTPALANGYAAPATKVSSVYEPGDVKATFSNFTVNTVGSGDYDSSSYPILLDHIASVEQDWTLTFTSATAYTISGDEIGAVGSGNISAGATPLNPNYAKPYFTIQPAGFSGVFQAGDAISFTTSPAAVPLFYRRQVPAGAASLSGNSVVVAIDGESA